MHTLATDFHLAGLKALPQVDIIYDHQSAGPHQYQASIQSGAQGIIVAATGNGSLSSQAEKGLRLAVKHKIACVRSSRVGRSEEHTSELQSLMRISYAVFCLKKKKKQNRPNINKASSLQPRTCAHDNIT